MEVKVDRASINKGLRQMRQINRGITNATRRSINKSITFASRQISREIAAENKITQKVLKPRIFVRRATNRKMRASYWGGLNPIKAARLGAPKEVRGGVRVGKHRFEGAFTAQLPNARRLGVYKRKGRSRFPIVSQYLDLNTDLNIAEIETTVQSRFSLLLAQELNYEVNVKGLVK